MSLISPTEFDALTRLDLQVFGERSFAELNLSPPTPTTFTSGSFAPS